MKKITGDELKKLGFKKEVEESYHNEPSYHYYIYEVDDHGLFISCANDEKVDGGYSVEFYEIPELRFFDLELLKQQMEIINKLNK
jgi:hypothetical protein